MGDTVTIDCDDCSLQDTAACADCVVSFLLDRAPDDAVVIDVAEARAVRLLERRQERRVDADDEAP